MVYKILKDYQTVARFPRVVVSHGGALVCSDADDGVTLILADGHWDTVTWEEVAPEA